MAIFKKRKSETQKIFLIGITENKQNINFWGIGCLYFPAMVLFSWLRSFSPPVGGRGGEQMEEIAKISQMGRFPEVTRMEKDIYFAF